MVNFSNTAKSMKINLSGFKNIITQADQEILSGNPDAENNFENLQIVVPVKSAFKASKSFDYAPTAMSLTIIRIKTIK